MGHPIKPRRVKAVQIPKPDGRLYVRLRCPFCDGYHEHTIPSNPSPVRMSSCTMGHYSIEIEGE